VVGADPIDYLGAQGDDLWIRSAVYRRALELDSERRQDELKALAYVILGVKM